MKSSKRGTGSHVVSRRGRAVIYTRGWGPVSSARIVARCAIGDERAYALMPGKKAEWGWPCTHDTGGAGPCKARKG